MDELVEPFRAFNFKEQEVVLMKAIITLNPREPQTRSKMYLPLFQSRFASDIRCLTTEAAEQVADLRDRVQETLYNVVRESHPKEVASSRFGNLLLFLPNIMVTLPPGSALPHYTPPLLQILGNVMYENLQFIQSFGKQHVDPLLGELLDNIEPMHDLNGVNLDDVLSLSSGDNNHSGDDGMCDFVRSHSASSISSLVSGGHPHHLPIPSNHQQAQSELCLGSSVPGGTGDGSDADYNLTLTAENLSGMRCEF